jgi:hypothetical protein
MPKINDEYDIGAAFQAIENELIASMLRNMKDHKLDEADEGKQWSMWQTEQLKALEKYKQQNQKKYVGKFRDINTKIEALIRHSRIEGNMQQETEILNAIKSGFRGAKRISTGGTAEFFRLNDRKLEALIKATTSDMEKAETAVLRMANDQYRKIIFNAQVYANTGAGTYEKAVDMASKDMLAAGLNCVEYKNGARHTLADYADMAIRTASKRAYLQGEGEKRQEWGISTVIVNKRGNPCPKCLPFCGKVFIDDVWSGGSQKDGRYPLLSSAVAAGLYHPRCRDSHTTYFPEISTADDAWTKEELEKVDLENRTEAKQQYAKRQAEKFRRLAENSLDEDNKRKYQVRMGEWEKARENFSDQIDFMKIFKGKKTEIEERSREFYRSLLNVENEDMYQLLQQSYKRVKIEPSGKRRSYFSRKDKTIYLARNIDKTTIAHELFHEIDNTYGITDNGALKTELIKDYEHLKKISRGKSIADMIYYRHPEIFDKSYVELIVKSEYRGISDILSGLTEGNMDLGYYHSKEYWKNPGALQRETWAQYGRMYYSEDEKVLKILQELFPDTTKEFERIIKEMIK